MSWTKAIVFRKTRRNRTVPSLSRSKFGEEQTARSSRSHRGKAFIFMYRNLIFYIAVLAVFGIGIYFVLELGMRLEPGKATVERRLEAAPANFRQQPQPEASSRGLAGAIRQSLRHLFSILLLQVID